jgi:hypothetical protein
LLLVVVRGAAFPAGLEARKAARRATLRAAPCTPQGCRPACARTTLHLSRYPGDTNAALLGRRDRAREFTRRQRLSGSPRSRCLPRTHQGRRAKPRRDHPKKDPRDDDPAGCPPAPHRCRRSGTRAPAATTNRSIGTTPFPVKGVELFRRKMGRFVLAWFI